MFCRICQLLNGPICLSFIIAVVAVIGDKLGTVHQEKLILAIIDNSTHGLIGLLSWSVIVSHYFLSTKTLNAFIEIILCAILSSVIDLDHFITAKSFKLKDATSLNNRPFLHCSSVLLLISILLICIGHIIASGWVVRISWIFLTAFTSHHIRDSSRRGFWLWPFGSTNPLPYSGYITLQIIVPHIIKYIFNVTNPPKMYHVSYPFLV